MTELRSSQHKKRCSLCFSMDDCLTAPQVEAVNGHSGRVWIAEAGLWLGLWQGHYHGGEDRLWLRWFDAQGNWILIGDERAEHAEQRAERLAEQLRQLGQDPDGI
jgi:hypothetical protein